MKKNFAISSYPRGRSLSSLLAHMAADEARANRIREFKNARPDLTWQRIADEVGVSMRAAQAWGETGGIDYENAKRLAVVFGVDVDVLMRGEPDEPQADPVLEALVRIERKIDELLAKVPRRKPAVKEIEAAAKRSQARRQPPAQDPPAPRKKAQGS